MGLFLQGKNVLLAGSQVAKPQTSKTTCTIAIIIIMYAVVVIGL